MKCSTMYRSVLLLGAAAMLSTACGKDDSSDSKAAEIPATITLSGALKLGVTALNGKLFSLVSSSTPVAGDVLFCVTFEETPSAGKGTVGSDGKFSLSMPGGKALGCFLNSAAGATKATFVFPATTSVGSGGTTSMAFGKDIDFGELTVGADGKISVPQKVIDGATAAAVKGSSASSGIDLDKLHNTTYKLTCVKTGDAVKDAACSKDMEGDNPSPYVYWRVVKGTEGSKAVNGVGAWESKAFFDACGSIDATTAERNAIEGVSFSQFDHAAAYSTNAACKLDSNQTVRTRETLQGYYMLAEAVSDGAGGFSTNASDEYKVNSTCSYFHKTSIVFTGTNDVMYGAFISEERAGPGCTASEKSNAGEYSSSFNVKFTKQ